MVATVPAIAVLALLVLVAYISLHEGRLGSGDNGVTLRHFGDLYTDPFAYRAMLNTLGFATVTVVVSVGVGVPMAWLVERTDLGHRAGIFTALTIGVLIPGFFSAMGWLFLLHPRIGLVNRALVDWFGLDDGPLNVISLPGMGFVQGLALAPLVFVFTSASLRSMDAALEEAAVASGASLLTTIRRVTLPLAWPGILGATIFVFAIALSAFDVPVILGLSQRIYTFSTFLYVEVAARQDVVADYGLSAAFSCLIVVIALGTSWWYTSVLARARRYEVVTGKAYKPRLVPLGRWRIVAWTFVFGYLLVALVLPFSLLIWSSFHAFLRPISIDALQAMTLDNYRNAPWDLVRTSLVHTAQLVLIAPTIAVVISLAFSWVVLRSRYRFRYTYDYIAFLPHAVPNAIFAFGALVVALFYVRWPFDWYGSVALLVVVMVLAQLSFATRITNGALIQISRELEEAAAASGAGAFTVLRHVTLPLMRPALVYGWLWLALLAFRELTMTAMLASPDNITLSVVIFSIFDSGNQSQASAITVVMMAMLAPLALLCLVVGRVGADTGSAVRLR